MLRGVKGILICLLAVCGLSAPLRAEFIQTSEAVFQDLRTKVIATTSGIFIVQSTEAIPLQKFNPDELKRDKTIDIFIRYDAGTNRYNELIVGTKSFQIRGSFGIDLESVRIRVDNYSNPYMTIVINSNSNKPSILGFLGPSPVLNFASNEAVALLEANQSIARVSGIDPYELNRAEVLKLKGEEITSNRIGLEIPPPKNQCLNNQNALFIAQSFMARMRAIKEPEKRRDELDRIIADRKSRNFLSKLVILRVEKEIIAFDPIESLILAVNPKKGDQDTLICEYQKIEMN